MELVNDNILTKLIFTWLLLLPFWFYSFYTITRQNKIHEIISQIVVGIWITVFAILLILDVWI